MELTYAVGDIHGCRDLLVQLLEAIETDAHDRAYRSSLSGTISTKGLTAPGSSTL